MSGVRIAIGPKDDLIAFVHAAKGESVLITLSPDLDPLALAQAWGAIRALAVARAPGTRVNALLASRDAHPDDVGAAAAFLERARSTTGQVLEVGPR